MKTKKIILIALFNLSLLSLPLFSEKNSLFERRSRSAQELVPSGHWIYDAMMALSLENRALNFADSAPLSIQELRTYLDEVDYDSLSDAGRSQYDRIERYVADRRFALGSDLISISLEPKFNVSAFYKSNDDIDWVYDRYSREPVFDAPFVISCADYFAMDMEISLGSSKGASLKNDNYSNIPYQTKNMDVNFPYSAYFNTGYKFSEKTGVAFQIQQGSQSIGRTLGGSIIWSDHLTGTTQAKLSAYSPNVKYTATISEFNVDKYMYMHNVEARLFKKFTLGVQEGILVYAPMELRFMNPWTIFHGFAPWRDYGDESGDRSSDDPESHTCAYLGIKAEFTPVKYLRLYGLFAMTQYATPYEKENWPDSLQPDGLGGQWGAESYIPFREGYLHFGLEASYTQPYLYIKESPNWSLVRTYSENMGDHAIFYEWIGSPNGPDTISAQLTGGYEKPGRYSIEGNYLFMARGEMSGSKVFSNIAWGGQATEQGTTTAGWCYPETVSQRNYSTPHGTPEYVNRISLRGTWYAKEYLKFILQPAYVAIFNHNNQSGEKAFGFEIAAAVSINLIKF
ncbi:hypothetical protein [Treponema sp.]|uniref:hypothetical protein n=1 Tax=Treponema sp. TaxID=166 RepID=UPI0025DD555B|nr:hypothetical protein [Treponema sp.]MBR4321108.1 hypothetical protein [Treponema sp.]